MRFATARRLRLAHRTLLLLPLLLLAAFPAMPVGAEQTGATRLAPPVAADAQSDEQRTAAVLDAIRASPPLVNAFLRQMPKGGDIHNHLTGAVYAENYIAFGAQDGTCIELATMTAGPPPCDGDAGRPPLSDALANSSLYSQILSAWSMRFFVPGDESGHDHFFNTFGKFGYVSARYTGAELADVARDAAAQNETYLELMYTPDGGAASRVGASVGWDDDMGQLQQKLLEAGLADGVRIARQNLDQAEADMRTRLACGTPEADAGCTVTIRYLYQANRLLPREQLFAQFQLGFLLAQADPRVVGLNLVAPEDDYRALLNYDQQMLMLDYLFKQMPSMNIALHAGELTLGIVPPDDLRFHIRHAVELGHAKRIGHGVDVMYEDNPGGLLAEMSQRNVLVEINLTSNDVILGVNGDQHPFPVYLAAGVPVALSTDDEGVSRIDLTHEYERAVETYGVAYTQLKALVRNSIEYSFLPGADLWQAPRALTRVAACADDSASSATLSDACRSFLDSSEKAAAEWNLERAFVSFEQQEAAGG